jgi:hypothetical protein
MKTIRWVALLGALLLTASELFALDYGTSRLVARHSLHAAAPVLLARR